MSELLQRMTNVGVRAPDLDAEIAFLETFGATSVIRTQRMHEGAKVERVRVEIGGTRILLFTRATYDDRLDAIGQPRGGGLSHMAFSVDRDATLGAQLAARGVAPLYPTFVVGATEHGPERAITFYRSPNGLVIETQQNTK